jgi:hypothetical protein
MVKLSAGRQAGEETRTSQCGNVLGVGLGWVGVGWVGVGWVVASIFNRRNNEDACACFE